MILFGRNSRYISGIFSESCHSHNRPTHFCCIDAVSYTHLWGTPLSPAEKPGEKAGPKTPGKAPEKKSGGPEQPSEAPEPLPM